MVRRVTSYAQIGPYKIPESVEMVVPKADADPDKWVSDEGVVSGSFTLERIRVPKAFEKRLYTP